MPLHELRHARQLTQEALGGELEIVARFPDGAVKIRQFEEIGASAETHRTG